jgi:hypothetical protein
MPRARPPVYSPIAIYVYSDLIVEVYRDDEFPAGRGLHGRYKKAQTFDLALQILLDAREEAKKGIRRQLFADIRKSAAALERELTRRYGRRHSIQIQQRICRRALHLYGQTGDDQVRLPYVFDSQKQGV